MHDTQGLTKDCNSAIDNVLTPVREDKKNRESLAEARAHLERRLPTARCQTTCRGNGCTPSLTFVTTQVQTSRVRTNGNGVYGRVFRLGPGSQAPVRHLPQGLLRRDIVVAVVIDLRRQEGLGIRSRCVNVGYCDHRIRAPSRRRDRTLSSFRTTTPTYKLPLPSPKTTVTYLSLLGTPPSVQNPQSRHPRCP